MLGKWNRDHYTKSSLLILYSVLTQQTRTQNTVCERSLRFSTKPDLPGPSGLQQFLMIRPNCHVHEHRLRNTSNWRCFDYLILCECPVSSGNGSGHRGDEFPGVDRGLTAFIQKKFVKVYRLMLSQILEVVREMGLKGTPLLLPVRINSSFFYKVQMKMFKYRGHNTLFMFLQILIYFFQLRIQRNNFLF